MCHRRNMSNASQAPAETPRSGGRVRASIEAVLLATGLILLSIFAAAQVERFLISRELSKAFPASGLTTPPNAPQNPSLESEPAGASGESRPAAKPAPGTPLAVLRIPSIHLDVPVVEGTDALTLNHAAGRIAGTALPGQEGNIGIAAHRDSFFRNLGKVRIGDPIELETKDGVTTYIVEQTQIVTPDNVSVLDPRRTPSLTLVTCYPFHYLGRAPQRYIVTALLRQPAHGHTSAARSTNPRSSAG